MSDGSYPDVAARAVASASQQTPSPIYGYFRVGSQQKIYLFGTLEQGSGWLASIVHAQAQPYDYAAVFAASDLSHPVPGMESFGHTVVSGGTYVGADGSYPEVAARAVANAAQQASSPLYGYYRHGSQQKVYLFGAIADAQQWLGAFAHGQAPYDYAAVFAASDLSQPIAGMESFAHTAYVGADGSYPEVASRAVMHAAQQAPSPLYGYYRLGGQQKVYLFGAITDAQQWIGSIVHGQSPYEYVAVFSASDLSRPVPGLESFSHAAVSGTYVGQLLPFLLGLPLGGAAGYFLRRWQEDNPGRALPGVPAGVLKAPNVPPAVPKTSGDYVGGPWLDIAAPYVGGPWLDVIGPQVGGPWLDIEPIMPYGADIADPWLPWLAGDTYAGASYGYDRPYHVESEADRRRRWPQTRALIESAKREAVDFNASYPAAALVWSLDSSGPSSVPGAQMTGTTMTMPFSSYAEALDYMRSRMQTPHVALALFDTASPHWPNPVSWTKSDDPVSAQIIAERTGTVPRVSAAVGSAIDDVRDRAQSLAARREGDVIGVIHTSTDGLWHTLAFRSSDDADDWLGTATQDPAAFTYAAYYDKQDFSWPHPVNEKVGGSSPGKSRHHRHGWAA